MSDGGRADFLIVGGGIAGLGTAWRLAGEAPGARIVLVEAEPHLASHSSAKNAAILRSLCGDPLATRIAQASARVLRDPPAGFSDVPLVDARGLVLCAAPEAADELARWVKEHCDDARAEPLSRAGLELAMPALSGEVAAAWSFPEEGRIDIGALVAGFVRGARQRGVVLRRATGVEALVAAAGRVQGVRLADGEEIRATTTILAAGGWAGRLGRRAGSRVSLRPTRRHLLVTAPHPRVDRRWPVLWHLGASEFYCRPESGGMLLCACEIDDVDPESCAVSSEVEALIAAKVARHLPSLAGAGAAHFWCGVRTLTADDRFAIGPDPDLAGLFWVAGLGGAGMVCSFEVARLAAEGVLGHDTEPMLRQALAPSRLAGGAPAA